MLVAGFFTFLSFLREVTSIITSSSQVPKVKRAVSFRKFAIAGVVLCFGTYLDFADTSRLSH